MKRNLSILVLFLTLFAGKVLGQLPQGSLNANGPFCESGAGLLTWTATTGTGPYTIVYKENSGSDRSVSGIVSGTPFAPFTPTVTSTTVYDLVSVTDESNSNTRYNGFTKGTATITVNPLPQGTITANGPFCGTGSGMLTWTSSAGTGPYTILYTENGGPNRSATGVVSGTPFAAYTPTVTTTTNYVIVSVTDETTTCSRSTSFDDGTATITVNPLPQGTLTANGPFCVSGSGMLTWTSSAGTGPYTILYTENGGPNRSATGVVSGTPFAAYTPTVTTTTNYVIVSVTDETTTCSRSTSFDDGTATITINPLPQGTLTANGPFCATGSGMLTWTSSAGTGPYTILYTENGGPTRSATGVVSGTPFAAYTPTVTTTTNYVIVSVTDQTTSCSRSTSFDDGTATITVNPLPTLTGASQNHAVCSGSAATIDLTGLLAGTTSTVYYSIAGVPQTPVTGVDADADPSFETGLLTPENNGKVLTITGIRITSPATLCYQSFSVSLVLIVNTANTPLIDGDFSTCVNSTGNVYTTDAGMTGYSWIISGGGTITDGGNATDNFVEVTWNSATAQSVSVNYTNSNGCSSGTPTVKPVTVNSLPAPAITGPSPVCTTTGGNVYTTEEDMTLYTWNVSPGNLITSGGNGNMIIVTWNTTGAQSVDVNYTDANGCRASTAFIKPITVHPLPSPPLTGPTSVCVNSSGNLYSTTPGMTNYIWTVSPGGAITAGGGSADNSVTITWNTAGSKNVSVNYTDGNLCKAGSATSLPVTVNPLPVPSVSGPASPNVNTSGHVYSTDPLMTGYSWTISPGGLITAGGGTNSVTVTWNSPGAQTLSVNYVNSNSCTATAPSVYNVTVNARPVAGNVSISGLPRSGITLYGSYSYSDADGDSRGTPSYQWYTGTSLAGADLSAIPLATSASYKLTDAQLGSYIGFSVVPTALTGASPGLMATSVIWIGPVVNDPPVAAIQPITGSLDVNGLLTGHYSYSDTEGDLESGTFFQWYSHDAPTGTFTPISGETGISHVIKNSEQGRYFKIRVTPVAATGDVKTGNWVESPVIGPANSQPTASNVLIGGTAAVGSTLSGSYVYDDEDPGDSQGTSTFRWLRNGTTPIPGATNQTYLVTPEDEGYTLSFEVTPVSTPGYPFAGTPVASSLTLPVVDPSSLTPVASQVCIEGIRSAGQVLRGKYYYDFYKSEGASTYQWYRNGVAIAGATGIQYTLLQVEDIDSNADITFAVIPKSSNIPAKVGSSVSSRPLARILIPKDQYSVSESDVTLSSNVIDLGGVFSGTGVTGNIFSPEKAGSAGSPHTLSYLLNIPYSAHNCSMQASKIVYVNPNVSSFVGFDPLYCHNSGPDMISVSGVPTDAFTTILGFTCTDPDAILTQSGINATIDPGKMRPGMDVDKLFFSYTHLGIFYQINQSFRIDSVSTKIRILNLDPEYCQNNPREYITIEGLYPLGGTAIWTGDLLSDTKPGSAYADPSIVVPGASYPVSYQYRSLNGCYSELLRDTVVVNKLPDPYFPLDSTYNIDGGSILLVPNQSGGTFTGNGVSGERLFPDLAGQGKHEIRYNITDTNKCSASYSDETIIRKALGTFADIPSVICYSDTTYNIRITGLPTTGVVEITGFSNKKNTLIYTLGDTDADYNVPAAGNGVDTLYFTYKWDDVDYEISKGIEVDSIGDIFIKNLTSADLICTNMGLKELFPSETGGLFTGPVTGNFLNPNQTPGPAVVSYTYTRQRTGCSKAAVVPVTIYAAPQVSFAPQDFCIEGGSDTTRFQNNTISSDPVSQWQWEFSTADGTKTSNRKDAGFLYSAGGLQKVTLTATTVNNCAASKESTFNFGIRPVADFYWKKDCMHPGDSIILIDTTKSTSPIASKSWRIFGGPEFSTELKEAKYPKTDTGYLAVQYIVRTTYLDCNDTVRKDIYIKPSITIPSDGYLENFETGMGGWIKSDTAGNKWAFGLPGRETINTAYSGQKAWYTDFENTGLNQESSSIVSPCFDFTTIERPEISLWLYRIFTRDIDGAVLQYKIGDRDEWQTVGAIDDGIQWYNSAVIRGKPGGNTMGWTTRGEPDNEWVNSIHTLDELKGKSDVVFRIAYGSDGSDMKNDGIAFDDIRIVERSRKILLEHFTNLTDESGFNADGLVNKISKSRKEDVINIQYHTNFPVTDDPFYMANTADAGARILFYGLTRTPYSFIDGGTDDINYATYFSYMTSATKIDSNYVIKRSLIPAQFDIDISTQISGGVLTVSAMLTALDNISTENLTLYFAVTEDSTVVDLDTGEKLFLNVFRKFIPDAAGIPLKSTWIKGETSSIIEQSWPLISELNKSNIEVIAFVQDAVSKKVYQAESDTLADIDVGIKRNPEERKTDFRIYPNPAINRVVILFGDILPGETDIKIYDMQGLPVLTYKAEAGIDEFIIDNLKLKQGLYLVRLSRKGIDLGSRKLVVAGR